VALSPSCSRLASGSRDGIVRVCDARAGQQEGTLTAGSTYVNSPACSPDGQRIAPGNWNGAVNPWERRPERRAAGAGALASP
jgi:WD40 repeat protein